MDFFKNLGVHLIQFLIDLLKHYVKSFRLIATKLSTISYIQILLEFYGIGSQLIVVGF